MEAFAKSVNAGGCDYLSKLPWCFKMACVTQRERVGGRYEKPDGTHCFLKSCYRVAVVVEIGIEGFPQARSHGSPAGYSC